MRYIKSYWKRILWVMAIIVFPFVVEWVLFATPVLSKFDNEIWFSFIGSYIGAIITLGVMFITFKKSDEENKKIVKLQKKQHEIDMQNEKLMRIIHILLLDDYHFLSRDTVCENIEKFMKDLHYVQFDTLKFKYIAYKDDILMDELLRLQMEEVEIIKSVQSGPHVDSKQTAEEFKMFALDLGLRLSKVAESRKETIIALYDNHLKNVYEYYYE